jgi:hypothetical protein
VSKGSKDVKRGIIVLKRVKLCWRMYTGLSRIGPDFPALAARRADCAAHESAECWSEARSHVERWAGGELVQG